MASVYKRTRKSKLDSRMDLKRDLKAIPRDANVKDGVASWTDRTGCKRTAVVSDDRVEVVFAEWVDDRGHAKSAPVDHTLAFVLLVDSAWMGSFADAKGNRVRKSTKTSDKAAAIRIANKWEADARLRQEGVVDGVAESLARHGAKPIAEHVDDFISFRAIKGGTEEHRTRTRRNINEFVDAAGWRRITDIDAADVSEHVATLRTANAAARTIQGKLQSIKSFTKWLADHHRLMVNPLSMIRRPDPNSDRRHERRMLLPDEWQWLSRSLQTRPIDRNSMPAAERLLLYRLAIQTGLRAGEVFPLTRNQIVLSRGAPHILCKAPGTKNRKPAKQYIAPSLADALRDHIATKHPTAPVFGIGSKEELARGLELDLAAAKSLWLESFETAEERIEAAASDFLERTNHDGEHLVFHSLRHTCGAWLAMSGEHVKTVQSVMRHGSISLTMDRYGHLFPGQAEGAVSRIGDMLDGTSGETFRTEAG
jgi:integrase